MGWEDMNIGDISEDFGSVTNRCDTAVILAIKLPLTGIMLTVEIEPGESKQSPPNAFANVYESGKYTDDELAEMQSSSIAGIPLGKNDRWEVRREGGRILMKKA